MEWDAFLARHPEAHLLQTSAWGAFKSEFGWRARPLIAGQSGALVLLRTLAPGLRLAYVPKGPLGPVDPSLIAALDALCRQEGVFLLKVEPDEEEAPEVKAHWQELGFTPSPHCIQPRRTLLVDLAGDEEQWLARMRQKTRYNIRLAARKGVIVHPWKDVQAFAHMMVETARRDGFAVHSAAYYRRAYEIFHPGGMCELLVAEFEGQPLAALMVFAHGRRAWYFYGASTNRERNRMPTYRLQWEAMRWAKAQGCQVYDLWGIPDADPEELEAQFTKRRDGLWGVYRFKRGFGGRIQRSAGAFDRPYKRAAYALYRLLVRLRGVGE